MSPKPLKIQEQPQPVSSGVCYADLQDRVGPVAAVALDAEDEIPGPIAARRVDEPPAQEKKKNPRAGGYHGEGRRGEGGEGEEQRAQEVVVGAEGEEVVDALHEGALEDGPLPAEEGHHHQRRHRPVRHQQPRHVHPRRRRGVVSSAGWSIEPRSKEGGGGDDDETQAKQSVAALVCHLFLSFFSFLIDFTGVYFFIHDG